MPRTFIWIYDLLVFRMNRERCDHIMVLSSADSETTTKMEDEEGCTECENPL